MTPLFPRIGLMGKHTSPEIKGTLVSIIAFLQAHQRSIVLENNCANLVQELNIKGVDKATLASSCDLAIVVGGDGSLLDAARLLVDNDVPVVGINRGRRGFLTDISPQVLTSSLEPLLQGHYKEERRFLLDMSHYRDTQIIHQGTALNDVVLHSGNIAKMIEFQVIINGEFVYRQRSDGIVTATPTGSTAYALAGGGPILHPSLNAIVLVPMHPPMLSSRPIVIDSNSDIELHLMPDNVISPRLSCDGQTHFDVKPNDTIVIKRKTKELRLLHPTDYDYYHTLRTKLGWTV